MKQEPANAEHGLGSAVLAPEAETGSAGTATTAADSTISARTGDVVKTEPADAQKEEAAAPPGEGSVGEPAAADQHQQEPAVPQLVKRVHSARSVFRQRDGREYDPFTAQLERRITKLFEVSRINSSVRARFVGSYSLLQCT